MFLLEFFAIGTWAFWAVILFVAIAMSECLDTNHPGIATIMAISVAALLWLLGCNPFMWIVTHPAELLLSACAYVVTGCLWSLAKWYFWLIKIRRFIQELSPKADISTELWHKGYPRQLPPNAFDNKTRILGWMTLWPASMIWTVLHDPVKWVFEEMYALMGRTYQKISDYVFKDIKDSFK